MKYLISTIAILLGPLSGCMEVDVRDRTYAEVVCFGVLTRDHHKFLCTNDDGRAQQIDRSKSFPHTVTVNRRTGTVAFDGQIVGECRVADFDAWECIERVPARGGFLNNLDIIKYRSGIRGIGYLEEWCNVESGAPAVRNRENCLGQRYYGMPAEDYISRVWVFMWDQFCSSKPPQFCSWF